MATSRLRTARTVTVLVAAAVLAAACGSSAPSASPTPVPTPLATPNPHLPSPATAKQVFAGLGKAGLSITANTATLGADGSDVVTKIFATYLGWPLDVTEYRSAKALTAVVDWPDGEAPGKGEPPIALAGMNILITWGPTRSGHAPGKLNGRQVEALTDLVSAADVLLSPLRTRSSVPVRVTAAKPDASAAPSPSPS
ncbi:MAG TPA: hypothetical protein VK867_08165 [Candidatus Limnocylindrales bacterium]|nr:hypothetical protein [Candidatus Limnocylindrales bacterium]